MRFRGAYGYLSIGIQEDIKDSKDKGNIHFVLFRGKIREGGKQEKELRKRGSVSIKKIEGFHLRVYAKQGGSKETSIGEGCHDRQVEKEKCPKSNQNLTSRVKCVAVRSWVLVSFLSCSRLSNGSSNEDEDEPREAVNGWCSISEYRRSSIAARSSEKPDLACSPSSLPSRSSLSSSNESLAVPDSSIYSAP